MLASRLSSPGGRCVLTWPYIVGTDIQAGGVMFSGN